MSERPRLRPLRFWLPLLVVCSAPFLFGAVFVWISALLVALLSIALFSELWVKRGAPAPKAAYALLGVFLVAAASLIPLPPSLVGWLSPLALETREFVLGGLGEEVSWMPLSMSPPETVASLLLCVGTLLAFLMGASVSARRRYQHKALLWIGSAGGVMALLVGAHQLIGVQEVYGFYETQTALTAPLINPNHLASFETFAALTALGVALYNQGDTRRWMFLCAVISLGVVFVSNSRGGMAAAVLGLLLYLLVEARARQVDPRRLFGAAAIVALGLATLALVFTPQLREASHQVGDDIKVSVWSDSLGMLEDFSLVGVGRGAFAAVFPRYQSFPESFNVRSSEMLPLSIFSETGLLGLIVSGVLAYWLFVPIWRRSLGVLERGAFVGLLTLALHDLADFSLDIPGIALPAAFTAGILCGPTQDTRKRGLATLSIVLAVLTIPGALLSARAPVGESITALQELTSKEEVRSRAIQELSRRPSAGYIALAAASRLLSLHDPKGAMPFINRARYLLPQNREQHLLAARALRRLGLLSQARLEYRGSLFGSPLSVYEEALAIAPDEESLRSLIPQDRDARKNLAMMLAQKNRHREALNIWWGLLEGRAEEATLWSQLGEAALSAGEFSEAEAAALALKKLEDRRWPWLLSRTKKGQQDPAGAQAALEEGTRKWPQNSTLWLQLGELCLTLQNPQCAQRAGETAKQLESAHADGAALEGRALEAQGYTQGALSAYQEALQYAPESFQIKVLLARLYEKLGRFSDAMSLYQDLAQEAPEFKADIERLRQ